jgi:hypothetical protein
MPNAADCVIFPSSMRSHADGRRVEDGTLELLRKVELEDTGFLLKGVRVLAQELIEIEVAQHVSR